MLNKEQELNPVEGIVGQIYSLAVYDDKLFCAGTTSLGVLGGNELYYVNIRGVWWVKPLQRKDRLLIATYNGLYLLKKVAGRWELDQKLRGRYIPPKACI